MTHEEGGDQLHIELELTIAGTKHTVPSGNVKICEIHLASWGFEGYVEFVLMDDDAAGGQGLKDELLEDFLKPDLVELSLSITTLNDHVDQQGESEPLHLSGLVRAKTLREQTYQQVAEDKVLSRYYGVHFTDDASLLWKQHYPCVLYAETSQKPTRKLQEVLDAHKADRLELTYNWPELDKERPLIFLSLTPEDGASFYDFVMWFVATRGGVFRYDYANESYEFAGAKDESGEPVPLFFEHTTKDPRILLPEQPRYAASVLNSYTENALNQEAHRPQKPIDGIRQDVLLCTQINDEFTSRKTLEKNRLIERKFEKEINFHHFPKRSFTPGALVEFTGWPDTLLALQSTDANPMRVVSVELRAQAIDMRADADQGRDEASYHFSMRVLLEHKGEKFVRLPAFRTPRYPLYAEGKIVSEVGDQPDETYQAYTDDATSIDHYKVEIALWDKPDPQDSQEKQKVIVPYNPNLFPGHFYFPAYKGERVLVAFDFDQAWLKRFLDWRAGARLPAESQGNHLLLGKTTTSSTSMKHTYENDKPVFTVLRTNEKDNQMLQIKEGSLLILVKEDPSDG